MKFRLGCSIAALTVSLSVVIAICVQGASTIQFTAASYTVAESEGFAAITVQRLSEFSTTASVDYATADGTATNGVKYTAVSGTQAFEASETNKTIVVPILNNGFVEGTKTFQVVLAIPPPGRCWAYARMLSCVSPIMTLESSFSSPPTPRSKMLEWLRSASSAAMTELFPSRWISSPRT